MGIATKDKRRIAVEATEQGRPAKASHRYWARQNARSDVGLSEYRQTGKDAPNKRGHPPVALPADQLEQLLCKQNRI